MRTVARTVVFALAVVAIGGGGALAQTAEPPDDKTGVVAYVDGRHNVIVLADGRMFRATRATTITSTGRPIAIGSLRPGTPVVLHVAEPVVVRGSRYVTLTDSPAASAGADAGAVRARTFGHVTDVGGDGDVKIQTQSGTLNVTIPPDAARMVKDGDAATLEIKITPPAPAVR